MDPVFVAAEQSSLALTPNGQVVAHEPAPPWLKGFDQGPDGESAGLMALAGHGPPREADAVALFWSQIAGEYIRTLCHAPGTNFWNDFVEGPRLSQAELAERVLAAPPMRGAEYLSAAAIRGVWARLGSWTRETMRAEGIDLAGFLARYAPVWSRVGRVALHLAENRRDPEYPFAFMATYASDVSQGGRLTQLPLAKALQQYAGMRNKAALARLLVPLHAASKGCPLLGRMMESGDVFHPLRWTAAEAYAFLRNVPVYEEAGLVVRIPNWWQKQAPRPRVTAVIGEREAVLGLGALLDFKLWVEIDGEKLTRKEVEALLKGEDGLVQLRGKWIEVDRAKLEQALEHWRALERSGISVVEGLRLLAGAPRDLAGGEKEGAREWMGARAGDWLEKMLANLASPQAEGPPRGLRATLRGYQVKGVDWLWFCARAGLGACLADDMGLGKTVQVLAALLRKKEAGLGGPSLLVAPASLIGNWKREAAAFAPTLQLWMAHASAEGVEAPTARQLSRVDLVITTFGMVSRLEWIERQRWSWVIVDEAQAIKNPGSRQSKAVRRLAADSRIALTGTPVENHLGDLWSLFAFLNPGLLGTPTEFKAFVKRMESGRNGEGYAPLRRLAGPYILRRMKTDKTVIDDLPDKTEMKVLCGLSPRQAKLYEQTAEALRRELETAEGIQRRGLVLAYLMRFKQVCNHPDQLTKTGDYDPEQSAKFERLMGLCEEIASRGEKALIFTQFTEIMGALGACLTRAFGRRGLELHGQTPVKERQRLVEQFQREAGPPYFVLSLKAGGSGLNLTAASHVIHFDRWWNPAVENQATDRAFRIGQRRNVLVHKFVVLGTVEERIDAMISEKQSQADAILEGGMEKALTELTDQELMRIVQLDLASAQAGSLE